MKKFNILLVVAMIMGTISCMLLSYDSSRLPTYLLIIPVIFAPILLNKTRFKLEEKKLFVYYVFIFFSDFLGCIVNLYNSISWYDTVVHFISGIFSFLVGLFIFDKIEKNKYNIWLRLIFGLCIVSLITVMWEIFEFSCDVLFCLNLQNNSDTGVVDTMVDIIAAVSGGFLIFIYYCLKNKTLDG